jgi:hypothetical protein
LDQIRGRDGHEEEKGRLEFALTHDCESLLRDIRAFVLAHPGRSAPPPIGANEHQVFRRFQAERSTTSSLALTMLEFLHFFSRPFALTRYGRHGAMRRSLGVDVVRVAWISPWTRLRSVKSSSKHIRFIDDDALHAWNGLPKGIGENLTSRRLAV